MAGKSAQVISSLCGNDEKGKKAKWKNKTKREQWYIFFSPSKGKKTKTGDKNNTLDYFPFVRKIQNKVVKGKKSDTSGCFVAGIVSAKKLC